MIFSDILNIITIFQLLLLALVLLFVENNEKRNRFLAAFLIIQSFGIIDALLWRYFSWSVENVAHFIFIPHMLSKMWGVGLMFYVLSMITPSFKLRKIDILHLIPMLAYGIHMFFVYFRYPLSLKKEMLLSNSVYSSAELIILVVLTQLVNISYLIYVLVRLKKYSASLRDYYSSTDDKNLKWLQFVIIAFSFLWLVALTQYSITILFGKDTQIINLANPIIFFISCYIVVRGWVTPEVFFSPQAKRKYRKYTLSGAQKKTYLERLESIMQKEKPFLDPDLTLSTLSKITSIPERHLSQVINESLGKNFYDYINGFRIRESIRYLIDSPVEKNILEILFDVGFNSKTTFNVSFKKQTGMSPSEYKKSILTPKVS